VSVGIGAREFKNPGTATRGGGPGAKSSGREGVVAHTAGWRKNG